MVKLLLLVFIFAVTTLLPSFDAAPMQEPNPSNADASGSVQNYYDDDFFSDYGN